MCVRHRLNEGKLLYCSKKKKNIQVCLTGEVSGGSCRIVPHRLTVCRFEMFGEKCSWIKVHEGLSVQFECVKVMRLRRAGKTHVSQRVCLCDQCDEAQ